VLSAAKRPQAGLFGWAADYPSAADFLNTLFSCKTFSTNPNLNTNVSEFCNPVIQRDIDAALTAQEQNRQDEALLWSKVDRAIVNRAVWAPIWVSGGVDVVSARVGNYQNNVGIILDQLWLR
jgi:peptide/nickel transport system substrate-binding protein